MKTTQMLAVLAILLLAFTGCDDEDLCLRGGGQTAEYELDFSSFSRISLEGPVNLAITQGPVQSVKVVAEPELFGPMNYQVRNGELEIGYEENVTCFETTKGVWIYVTVPSLTYIEMSGDSEIISEGPLDLAQLEMVVFGQGFIQMEGTIDVQRVVVEGSATVKNLAVESESVFLVVDGSANTEFNCNDLLDLDITGSAYVGYKGLPEIRQDVSGSLDLQNLN